MSDSDALKRPEWCDELGRAVKHGEDEECRPLTWSEIADLAEECWEEHLATLPVAEPCGHAELLRECREWVEVCRNMLRHGSEDRLAAQECLERIDKAIEEQP